MSQEELTPEDLDKFENLLERSGLIQRQKREALCYKIGIKPGDLEFIDRADDIFATLLTRRLNETRNKQALCLLFNKIEEELKRGDWKDELEIIRGKLQCPPSSSSSAPSVNPSHPPYPPQTPSKFPNQAKYIFISIVILLGGFAAVKLSGVSGEPKKGQNHNSYRVPEQGQAECLAAKDIKIDQLYNIIHNKARKALDGDQEGNVYLSYNQNNFSQQWKFIKNKYDMYQIQQSGTNRYLDASLSSSANYYNVFTTPNKEDTTKQQWKLENSNGFIVFINNTDQEKNTLDSGGQGDKVYLHERPSDFQYWCVRPIS